MYNLSSGSRVINTESCNNAQLVYKVSELHENLCRNIVPNLQVMFVADIFSKHNFPKMTPEINVEWCEVGRSGRPFQRATMSNPLTRELNFKS